MRGYLIRCAFCFCEVTPHTMNRFTFYCPACDRPIFPWHTEIGDWDGGFIYNWQSGPACPWPVATQADLRNDIMLAKEIEPRYFLEFRQEPGERSAVIKYRRAFVKFPGEPPLQMLVDWFLELSEMSAPEIRRAMWRMDEMTKK